MPLDVYQTVTDKVLAALEAGTAPWRDPILTRFAADRPQNLVSGHAYRGCNVFLLAMSAWSGGYTSNRWLTFNQAKALSGSVRKGERSTLVVFWKLLKVKDRETGEEETRPVLRYYRVFNAEQCDLPAQVVTQESIGVGESPATRAVEFDPIPACEAVVEGYQDGPLVQQAGAAAVYRPSTDEVRVPTMGCFESPELFYATLFHELAHSTGHSKRLNRGLDTATRPFGSPDYSREELVAEMASAFLCGHSGIDPTTIDNQAAYLKGWIDRLRGDKRLIVQAGGQAQKAADLILGVEPPQREEEDE